MPRHQGKAEQGLVLAAVKALQRSKSEELNCNHNAKELCNET